MLLALIDYQQVAFELDGQQATAHHLTLTAGKEHIFDLRLPLILSEGIHRMVLMLLDADNAPGLAGAYDLLADLYVGASPTSLTPLTPTRSESRADDVIRNASYGLFLTRVPDRLQLVSFMDWHAGLTTWISFWGSVVEGERPVAVVVLQNYEQLRPLGLDQFQLALPGRVSTFALTPPQPNREIESLRVLMITNPNLELVPAAGMGTPHSTVFRAYAGQKAYVRGATP